MNSLNNITSYISFLPPEYLNNIGKKITFIESDVEKVHFIVTIYFYIVFFLSLSPFLFTLNEITEKKWLVTYGWWMFGWRLRENAW